MEKHNFFRKIPSLWWWVISIGIAVIAISIIIYIMPNGVFATSIRNFANRNGTDTWDWLAFIVALFSFVFAAFTWRSQYKTERNTMQIDDKSQQNILKELTCHLYRNLIVICAISEKLDRRFKTHYPSEESLEKLKIDMDAMLFRKQADNYDVIQELQLLLRNFNIEIDVALKHLTSKHVLDYVKERDLATLKFKMGYLTKRIVEFMGEIWGSDFSGEISEKIKKNESTRNEDHDKKNKDNELKKSLIEKVKDYPYYNNRNSYYCELFKDEEKQNEFFLELNLNILIEMEGKNDEGYEKILIIPFDAENN